MVKKRFGSLKVTSDVELHEGISFDVIDKLATEDHELEPKGICSQSCETHSHASPETTLPEGVDDSLNEGNVIPDIREQNLSTDANVEKNDNILIDSNGIGTSSSLLGNKNSRTLERRQGKVEKSISFEVLQQYFAGSLKDAAKSLGVCPTTMKRICRQHGISRWPSSKINKVNRSLSKLKRVIESVQGAEGAFKPTELKCDDGAKPLDLHGERDKVSSPHKTPESDDQCNKLVSQQELIQDQTSSQPEPGEDSSHCSKKRSSGEGSIDSPTSQGSANENVAATLHNISQHMPMQDPRIVTIKASYKEDIIRFRLPCNAGVVALNEEVDKRLKLEVGTFDIRYLDDDDEWVMLACDADLEECIEISRLSGGHVIRLSVHDIVTSLGSSCESSGG